MDVWISCLSLLISVLAMALSVAAMTFPARHEKRMEKYYRERDERRLAE